MKLDDMKEMIRDTNDVIEALQKEIEQREYVQEITTQIANEETTRREELQLRVKSMEQTEALLRHALEEQQNERQQIAASLMNRFAGSFPASFDANTNAKHVVDHLCKCLDDISAVDPDWYGNMIEMITDATNRIAMSKYTPGNLVRIRVHNIHRQSDQEFIFASMTDLNEYLFVQNVGRFTPQSHAERFTPKMHEQYFVYAEAANGMREFVSSDINQALDALNNKAWKLCWMEAVGGQ